MTCTVHSHLEVGYTCAVIAHNEMLNSSSHSSADSAHLHIFNNAELQFASAFHGRTMVVLFSLCWTCLVDYNAAWAAYWQQYAQAHGQQMQDAQQQPGAVAGKPLSGPSGVGLSPGCVLPAAAQTTKAATPQSQQDLQAQWAEYYRMAGAYYQQSQPQGGAPDGQGIHTADVRTVQLHCVVGWGAVVRCFECLCIVCGSCYVMLSHLSPFFPQK